MSGNGVKMKLKLNTNAPSSAPTAGSPPVATPGGSGLKLNFKPLSATPTATPTAESSSSVAAPKEKRKYVRKPKPAANADGAAPAAPARGSKKRKNEGVDQGAPPKKQAKVPNATNGTTSTMAPPVRAPPPPQRTLSIKINQKPVTQVRAIKLKHKGKPPQRPQGVGYDSEAEDAEIDPAIEAQFILRMQPGEDCNELRKAIDEKRVGEGFDVSFKFWDKEGRRATVTIRKTLYAAILVDLPCIVEGMKSFDKRGWYKSADICQMLWVLGRVNALDDGKTFPLPPEVQHVYETQAQGLYQFPHGLTPPMHYVRKRRFRKRVSYRTIEAVEEEVERLLQEDDEFESRGGTVDQEIIEPEALLSDAEDDVEEEDMEEYPDTYADADANGDIDAEGEIDGDDLEAMMMQAMEDDDEPAASTDEVANHGHHPESQGVLPTTETTPAASPAVVEAADETGASSDEDDEDGDEDEEEEIDEDVIAAQQENEQLREEIEDLEKEVELAKAQFDQQTNPLLKQRARQKLDSLRKDLELKKAQLGEGE